MKRSFFAAVAVAAVVAGSMVGLGGCGGNGGGGGGGPVGPVEYSVVVLDGGSDASGNGKYASGDTVTIKAGTPPDTTMRFKEWKVESGAASLVNTKNAVTTFVMPKADVQVRAVFEAILFYNVEVLDGGSAASGNGKYASGTTVTIKAGTPPDTMRFKEWKVESGAASLADTKNAVTTFVMPDADVRVRAVFEEIPFYNVVVLGAGASTGSGLHRVGETVIIFSGFRDGVDFESWTPDSVTFTELPNVQGGATFIMPESDIVVRANFVFNDDRNSKKYKVAFIGGKTWMAQNLNYMPETGTSKCYGDSAASCNKYGRLYGWASASAVCPTGWHLPSVSEWDGLINAVGGPESAGARLKATAGWRNDGNGTDDYGFSALPGGRSIGTSYSRVDLNGYWWTSTEDVTDDYDDGFYRSMGYNDDGINKDREDKANMYSVRCLKD